MPYTVLEMLRHEFDNELELVERHGTRPLVKLHHSEVDLDTKCYVICFSFEERKPSTWLLTPVSSANVFITYIDPDGKITFESMWTTNSFYHLFMTTWKAAHFRNI